MGQAMEPGSKYAISARHGAYAILLFYCLILQNIKIAGFIGEASEAVERCAGRLV